MIIRDAYFWGACKEIVARRSPGGLDTGPAPAKHGPMAYDLELAERIRRARAGREGVVEKSMFGGLSFLIGGNMAVGASGQGGMLLRADPAASDELTSHPGVERAVMQGRVMDGWLRVDESAMATDEDLARWVQVGVDYASSLPPKKR